MKNRELDSLQEISDIFLLALLTPMEIFLQANSVSLKNKSQRFITTQSHRSTTFSTRLNTYLHMATSPIARIPNPKSFQNLQFYQLYRKVPQIHQILELSTWHSKNVYWFWDAFLWSTPQAHQKRWIDPCIIRMQTGQTCLQHWQPSPRWIQPSIQYVWSYYLIIHCTTTSSYRSCYYW